MYFLHANSTKNKTNKGSLDNGLSRGFVQSLSSSNNNTPLLNTQKSNSLVFGGESDLMSGRDGIPSVIH